MSADGGVLTSVEEYYTAKLREHGPTAHGVDWNSHESQAIRFEQLLKLHNGDTPFSINDYGCGYGALVDHLLHRGDRFTYCGFDISSAMVDVASTRHRTHTQCRFASSAAMLAPADYTVASGIFNVKLQADPAAWQEYVFGTVQRLAALSTTGFAFNALTSYSDADRMRPDLYYADPCAVFDYCKRNFSRNVALLHDYRLYEFTMLVRL